MIYNFKSEKEADEFINKISNPYKVVAWAKEYLGIELPDPSEAGELQDKDN